MIFAAHLTQHGIEQFLTIPKTADVICNYAIIFSFPGPIIVLLHLSIMNFFPTSPICQLITCFYRYNPCLVFLPQSSSQSAILTTSLLFT